MKKYDIIYIRGCEIMYCLNCGCKVELGSKFCSKCGSPTSLGNSSITGKINVIRESKVFGFAISFDVYVDDSLLGNLSNGKTLSCNVPLGNHEIVFKSTEKDVVQGVVLTEEQNEVTLEIIPKMGLIAARPHINNIKYN